MDQVPVNAPGSPTKMIFFPAVSSLRLILVGGNVSSIVTSGMVSPTATFRAEERATNARVVGAKALAPVIRLAARSLLENIRLSTIGAGMVRFLRVLSTAETECTRNALGINISRW